MKEFQFHPELFEARARAEEALERAGLVRFADYSSIDIEHDIYGLEAGPFKTREEAERGLQVFRGLFPGWKWWDLGTRDFEPGFWFVLGKYNIVKESF